MQIIRFFLHLQIFSHLRFSSLCIESHYNPNIYGKKRHRTNPDQENAYQKREDYRVDERIRNTQDRMTYRCDRVDGTR